MTEYRIHLAGSERDWPEAERLQRVRMDWNRKRARPALETAPETRNDNQRNAIRTLAASLHELAEIQRGKGDPACTNAYREAFDLGNAIGDTAAQAICANNLGKAYTGIDIAELRNLDEAERWVQKSVDLRPPGDALGRGNCLSHLGSIAYLRFTEARAAKRPVEELAGFLAKAARLYEQALEMFPEIAINERGISHNQLGIIYRSAGAIDRALQHYLNAIRYKEKAGDLFGAGQTRGNVAMTLLDAGRHDDARAYADAALSNFQTFGERATAEIQKTESLIADIDTAAAEKRGNA